MQHQYPQGHAYRSGNVPHGHSRASYPNPQSHMNHGNGYPKSKFVIRPFKHHHAIDQLKARQIWEELQKAITQIFNQNASQLSFEYLYRSQYNLVLHKHADLLYEGVKKTIQQHLNHVSEIVIRSTDADLLLTLKEQWNLHQENMVMIRDILMYMDRTYCNFHKKIKVYDLGLIIFRDIIIRHPHVRKRLRNTLLLNVEQERNGHRIDRPLMKQILLMLVKLGISNYHVYEEEFERPFLEATTIFYKQESNAFISKNTCPDYMRKIDDRIMEEDDRAEAYLHSSTYEPPIDDEHEKGKLHVILDRELIENHATTLIQLESSGLKHLLKHNKIDDLSLLYDLLSRTRYSLEEVKQGMCDYITSHGQALVSDVETCKEPIVFVQGILDLKDKFDLIIKEAFRDQKEFQKKMQEAFESFINSSVNRDKCVHFLATYVDDLLKNRLKGVTGEEADNQLNKVIVIFKFIQDKDVFEVFYKQYLEKRLLSQRSINDDYERSMIIKLKNECGYHFTSKLEGMFTDIKISKESMEQFKHYLREKKHSGDFLTRTTTASNSTTPAASSSSKSMTANTIPGSYKIELDVCMLTMGYWPTPSISPCILPRVVDPYCSEFEEFYSNKHSGRKIAWQTQMGTADVKGFFHKGTYELSVSTYMMCIMMLFNEKDTLSLDEIRHHTNIPEDELRRGILSLCTQKHRILRKSSKKRGIEDGDVFTFNKDYESRLRRIRVPLVAMKEVKPAGKSKLSLDRENSSSSSYLGRGLSIESNDGSVMDMSQALQDDRRHTLEAVVVRIMKARRNLSHNDLVSEVIKQVHLFTPSPMDIKGRIESLIDREYIERDSTDRKMYTYLS